MKNQFRIVLVCIIFISFNIACKKSVNKEVHILSPDGSIKVNVSVSENGNPTYKIYKEEEVVLESSKLGLKRNDSDFSVAMKLSKSTNVQLVEDSYVLKTGKQKEFNYKANKQVVSFVNPQGKLIDITFQVSDDGVAFRYSFPEKSEEVYTIENELTTFNFSKDSKAWLQPCADAKTSWGRCNPSYEEHYLMDIPVGTPSPFSAGWVYPALYKTKAYWVIVTEAGLGKNYCATRLEQNSENGEYKIGFPQQQEIMNGGALKPASTLPWLTPWRVIALGNLKTVVESTLGTDVADPAIKGDFSWVKPGKSSWSWVLLKDDETIYPVQKEFVDYASEMGWEYCLVDAMWDSQIGYDKIQKLADYAKTKNVELILWYNSSGDWNDTHQTPKNMMLTHESRMSEFTRIKKMGIAGVKIDFFAGDGQSVIEYYHEILLDAAEAGIMVNFHGCTLPRGWQRTYPHLVSMESVKGMEYITFEQKDADAAVSHCAILPFTRNVFDPMDFTPVCFSEVPNIKRHSTNGFELALSVLFVSGVQHYAETPAGMAKVPDYVKNTMKIIPNTWDETVFVDGFPGKHVVIARRSGDKWFIAGINGEEVDKTLQLDLSAFTKNNSKASLITDGEDNRAFIYKDLDLKGEKFIIELKGNGGFLIMLGALLHKERYIS